MSSSRKALKLAIRIDDPPLPIGREDPQPCIDEIENMGALARKHECPLTLAVPLGWLHDLKHLHSNYKKLQKDGYISIACHGWYHEDFSGVGVSYDKVSSKGISLAEADRVLKRCQDFTSSFFGHKSNLFIVPYFREPSHKVSFNKLLLKNGFNKISNLAAEDPLCEAFPRAEGLWEITHTAWVDPFERKPYQTMRYVKHHSNILSRYMDAAKMLIDYRFKLGLYVHILTHSVGFWDKPMELFRYPGGNLGGKFFDELLMWVKKKYPEVKFVPVEGLVE